MHGLKWPINSTRTRISLSLTHTLLLSLSLFLHVCVALCLSLPLCLRYNPCVHTAAILHGEGADKQLHSALPAAEIADASGSGGGGGGTGAGMRCVVQRVCCGTLPTDDDDRTGAFPNNRQFVNRKCR